jgi:nucleoside-diphosphate-sugar epimerase
MRVLVTGHKGFIGTALVPMLQARGHEVVGIDADLYRNSTFGDPPTPPDHEVIKDVRDVEKPDLDGVDAILHAAALSNDMLGDLNPELTYAINHRASVRLAEMARDLGIERFVFFSSCSNYGAAGDDMLDENAAFNPVTAYAISKVRAEKELKELASDRFTPVLMRNATAYGVSPRIRFDVVLNNLTAWAYTTGHVMMKSDGTPWRPVVHIEDISTGAIAAMEAPADKVRGEAFNVGRNSENYRIRELATMVEEAVPDCRIEYAEDAGPDKRCYRADFRKYETTFPDHPLQWDARKGTASIYAAYKRIGLQRGEYEGPQYKRIAQLRHLLETGQLDDDLRWKA